jgi:hypothetical protein
MKSRHIVHNHAPAPRKKKTMATTKKKKKSPAKKPAAAKRVRKNPAAPAKKKRKSAKLAVSYPKTRRRAVRRNPKFDVMDVVKAAGVAVGVVVIGQVAALKMAQGDPAKQLNMQRLGGAAVVGLGAYLLNEGDHDLGLALVAGGASLAIANEATMQVAARIGAPLTTQAPAQVAARQMRGLLPEGELEGLVAGGELEGLIAGGELEGFEDDDEY